MLTNLKKHEYPSSIEEVLKLLENPKSKILAGGTSLSLESNDKIETLIDLQQVNLSYIKDKGDYFAIGAMTTAIDIYEHAELPEPLKVAANCVGDTPIMNAVTIGGNLAKFYYWVDLPPMLWALNASFILYTPEKQVMNADEFFAYAIESNIATRGDLIVEIQIPKIPENAFASYQSFYTTVNEKSQLNLAGYFEWSDGKVSVARIILGGSSGKFSKLSKTEAKFLEGVSIDELMSTARGEVILGKSYKTSVEYRTHILGVYIKRMYEELIKKMEGSQ
ncbi:MAG: FAD binding domain-containing protein [Candidatus Heimdallarchaeota archaeon]|nr:FAD binding domain-containing protein [Candidatus Heimdallarchaeota archaeon]